MGRLLRAFGLLVGLLLAGVGAVGAVLVGSDDTYVLDTASTGAAPGQVVATHRDITDWEQIDLVVRAEADGGAVLALGHAVDVTDYLDGTDHRLVTGLTRTELYSTAVEGDEPGVPVQDVDVWTEVTSGEGAQELTIPLEGEPVRLLAAPLAEDGTVALGFGAHVAGAFLLLVAVAVVGLLLAALSLWAILRRRGRGRDGSAGASGTTGESTSQESTARVSAESPAAPDRSPASSGAAEPSSTSGTAGTSGTSGTSRPRERRALPLIVLPVLAALALTGCGQIPQPAPGSPSDKVAMTGDQLDDVIADYRKRRLKAVRAARHPKYSTAGWESVDTGPQLLIDKYDTVRAEIEETKETDKPKVQFSTEQLYSGSFTQYPLWFAAVLDPRSKADKRKDERQAEQREKREKREAEREAKQSGKGNDGKNKGGGKGGGKGGDNNADATDPRDERIVAVMRRDSVTEPWRMESFTRVDRTRMPEPGGPTDPVPAQVRRTADKARQAVEKFWASGKKPGSVRLDQETVERRRDSAEPWDDVNFDATELSTQAWRDEDERLRIVPTDGGHLAITTTRLEDLAIPKEARRVYWKPGYERLHGSNSRGLLSGRILTSVIWLPDGKKPEVLATSTHQIVHGGI